MRHVFFGYRRDLDEHRAQTIRDLGLTHHQESITPQEWREILRQGEGSAMQWIDSQLTEAECLVVLIGARTSGRRWIYHEIRQALSLGIGMMGLNIHALPDLAGEVTTKGANPFRNFLLRGSNRLDRIVPVYDPPEDEPLPYIREHLSEWVEKAVLRVP